ncbi:MAG: sulfurtransferase [Bacteroidetes bacterium]|nr:MAG: sulfurtransferase [Bacteroidota bacterium]
MGPLTYFGEISTEWNYVIALFIGMAFGYIMEASGFSSSRKLVGVFYGYDFAVLRVFVTATLVAIIGLLYMGYFGWIDYEVLFVHPTFVFSAAIGGIIMGFGFITGGFCPGTSLCAAAIGKIDGIVFTIALFVGIMVYSWIYPILEPWYNTGNLGHIKITEWLGVSEGWFVFGFAIIAVVLFYITNLIRKKIKPVHY